MRIRNPYKSIIVKVAVFRGVMLCSGCIDSENGLCSVLADFFDSMRQNL